MNSSLTSFPEKPLNPMPVFYTLLPPEINTAVLGITKSLLFGSMEVNPDFTSELVMPKMETGASTYLTISHGTESLMSE
jgi:hypothetical protein